MPAVPARKRPIGLAVFLVLRRDGRVRSALIGLAGWTVVTTIGVAIRAAGRAYPWSFLITIGCYLVVAVLAQLQMEFQHRL